MPELEAVQIDGAALPYATQGDGEPIVFVHGSNADHRIWNAYRDLLSVRHRFITLTQRYFGLEDWSDNGEDFCMQTLADDLGAFVVGLDLHPATIVGWSLGGGICLTMAAQRPELVKRMFLYEPALASFVEDAHDAETVLKDRAAMSANAQPLADAGDLPGTVRAFMGGVNAERGAFDRLTPEVQGVMIENARMLPLLFAGPPAPTVSAQDLRGLNIPIIVALGNKSRSFYRIAATTAHKLLPRSSFHLIGGANHLWPVEDPQSFCRQVMEFLDETA